MSSLYAPTERLTLLGAVSFLKFSATPNTSNNDIWKISQKEIEKINAFLNCIVHKIIANAAYQGLDQVEQGGHLPKERNVLWGLLITLCCCFGSLSFWWSDLRYSFGNYYYFYLFLKKWRSLILHLNCSGIYVSSPTLTTDAPLVNPFFKRLTFSCVKSLELCKI